MIIIVGVITTLYLVLLLFLLYGYHQQPTVSSRNILPGTTFSIVIPFRNESKNLPRLLESLVRLKYPAGLFEILLIDDFSQDDSVNVCRSAAERYPHLGISLLKNTTATGSPKKNAIKKGIEKAKGTYIITTDADCTVPEDWLLEFNAFIQEESPALIAGPVRSLAEAGLWKIFEELDFFSLQAVTIGAFGAKIPFLCNGANLCYQKVAFHNLGGFDGNFGIASGDDIFLLEKFKKAGLEIRFLKNRKATVVTDPQSDLNSLVSQRIRWAAKTTAYGNPFPKILGLVILLMNAGLLIVLAAYLLGLVSPEWLLLPFLIKFNLDFILIYNAAAFFEREKILKHYFWCSLIYPFFSSYVAVLSLFKGYTWKGRRFRR